jgi:hypothetical protein
MLYGSIIQYINIDGSLSNHANLIFAAFSMIYIEIGDTLNLSCIVQWSPRICSKDIEIWAYKIRPSSGYTLNQESESSNHPLHAKTNILSFMGNAWIFSILCLPIPTFRFAVIYTNINRVLSYDSSVHSLSYSPFSCYRFLLKFVL